MGCLPILPPGPRRASFERCSGERSSSRKWSSFLTLQCREGFGKFKDNLPPCILSLLPGQGAHALFDMEPHCGRVVPDHLLGEPQKVLTSEECRVSLEDGLRSPNSSRLGVYMRVCVCVCVCVCVHAQMTRDQSCLSGLRDLLGDCSTGNLLAMGRRGHIPKTRIFERVSDKHKNTQ